MLLWLQQGTGNQAGLGNLGNLGSPGNQAVLGNLAVAGKVVVPGNQVEIEVCIPLEEVSLSLGEEAAASCIPDQEGGTEAELLDLQD